MSTTLTIGMSEAKTQFSRITADVNRTGLPVTVFKNNKPWVEICPLAPQEDCTELPQETIEALEEVEQLIQDPYRTTYKTADTLFSSLGI